jgi:hypothetical protein
VKLGKGLPKPPASVAQMMGNVVEGFVHRCKEVKLALVRREAMPEYSSTSSVNSLVDADALIVSYNDNLLTILGPPSSCGRSTLISVSGVERNQASASKTVIDT